MTTEDKIKKAFGGCLHCYGKGYSTVKQRVKGNDDFTGKPAVNYELPRMRFCDCERGKGLQEELERRDEDLIAKLEGEKNGESGYRDVNIEYMGYNRALDRAIEIIKNL